MLPKDTTTPNPPGTNPYGPSDLLGGGSGGSSGFDPRSQLVNLGVDPSLLSAQSGSGDNNSVFWGYARGGPSGARPSGEGGLARKGAPSMRPISSIMNEIYGSWSREKVTALGQRLASAGMIDMKDIGNLGAVASAYEKFLGLVADRNASGLLVTPDDLLKRFMGAGGAGAGLPATYTTSTKDFDLTNPKSARALMIQTLQQRLGRDPTAAEQQAFLGSLHAAERDDPTIRSTTYKLNPTTGSYDVASQSTKGGVDPSAFASEFGEKHNQKEYGAYQAAATYMPAMMEALAATVG